MRAIVGSLFAAFGLLLITQGIDLGISHAFVPAFTDIAHNIAATLSAHPLEGVVAGTVSFAVDPLDITYTLAEWRAHRRVSATTERRMRALGLGPRLVALSPGRWGVTRRDDLAWIEAGGAAQGAEAPPRRTGRDTRAATAASVAKRAERKAAAAPSPVAADSPAQGAAKRPPYGSPTDQHIEANTP